MENLCRVFTQEGDYPVAWISTPAPDGKSLHCIAAAGGLKDSLSQWDWQEVALDKGTHPMVVAFSTQGNVIINLCDGSAEHYGLSGLMDELNIRSLFLFGLHGGWIKAAHRDDPSFATGG